MYSYCIVHYSCVDRNLLTGAAHFLLSSSLPSDDYRAPRAPFDVTTTRRRSKKERKKERKKAERGDFIFYYQVVGEDLLHQQ